MEEDDEGREESLYKEEDVNGYRNCNFWSTMDIL